MNFKRLFALLLALLSAAGLCACGGTPAAEPSASGCALTDSEGSTVILAPDARVACGYASFAQCWLLAGGELVGITSDAVEDRGIEQGAAEIIGTVKSIDLELLAATEPDYVILSADLTAHQELRSSLAELGIACGYYRVDTFDDYKQMMAQFCAYTGRDDLYIRNVAEVEARIDELKARIPEGEGESVLLLRAYSTGMRAKTDDNLAGLILREFGMNNIADEFPSLLEELSMEQIILSDPRYIFVLTMGDERNALEYMRLNVENDPAWSGLSAVKEGRCYVLPQELFHYKPNERWDESYEYLAKIIFPQIFE